MTTCHGTCFFLVFDPDKVFFKKKKKLEHLTTNLEKVKWEGVCVIFYCFTLSKNSWENS